jgi:response regulator RpfG family c-di-GMP phosphodiesterase
MKKLLITDNLKSTIESGKSILRRKEVRLFTASSAEEVLNIHSSENVDLILTDFDIPGTGGDELCSILKDIRSDNELRKVSIIIICDNEQSSISRSYACGANTFITKPIDSVDLFSKTIKFLNISERLGLRVILNVTVKGQSRDKYFFANSENISNSGILFWTDVAIEEGEKIKCSFFAGGHLIATNAEVIRVDKMAPDKIFYGVHFLDLTPDLKDKIDSFINEAF